MDRHFEMLPVARYLIVPELISAHILIFRSCHEQAQFLLARQCQILRRPLHWLEQNTHQPEDWHFTLLVANLQLCRLELDDNVIVLTQMLY